VDGVLVAVDTALVLDAVGVALLVAPVDVMVGGGAVIVVAIGRWLAVRVAAGEAAGVVA